MTRNHGPVLFWKSEKPGLRQIGLYVGCMLGLPICAYLVSRVDLHRFSRGVMVEGTGFRHRG